MALRFKPARAALLFLGVSLYHPAFSTEPAPIQESACVVRFRELYQQQSAEWKRISVRDPDRPIDDPQYLQNLHDSMTQAFLPWRDHPDTQTFEDMLRKQHKILVAGQDGNYKYFGASRRSDNIRVKRTASPGVYRFERGGPKLELKIPISPSDDLKGFAPPKLQVAKDARARVVVARDEAMRTAPRAGGRFPPQAPIEPIRVPLSSPDIPPEAWTSLAYDGEKILQYYPSTENLKKYYLPALARNMSRLQSFGPVTEQNRGEYLALVADYVHLGVKAHPFDIGNYSLIMAQVNYLLNEKGLRPISHAQLDYQALVLDHTDFREIFRKVMDAAGSAKLPTH